MGRSSTARQRDAGTKLAQSRLSVLELAREIGNVAEACRQRGLRHIRTKPHTPKTKGKAERFIKTALDEWAYARTYKTSGQRAAHLPEGDPRPNR
jgi:hypothetical protein